MSIQIYPMKYLADGFFPDAQDPSKYHICKSGTYIVVSCPNGAIWNTVKKSCSYINLVLRKKDTYHIYETKSTPKGLISMKSFEFVHHSKVVIPSIFNQMTTNSPNYQTSRVSNLLTTDKPNIKSKHYLHPIFSSLY